MLHSTLLMPTAPDASRSQSMGSMRTHFVWNSPNCADPLTPEVTALWVLAQVPVMLMRLAFNAYLGSGSGVLRLRYME